MFTIRDNSPYPIFYNPRLRTAKHNYAPMRFILAILLNILYLIHPDTRNKGRGRSEDTYHLHGKAGEIRLENHVSCHYVREVSEKKGGSFEAVHFFFYSPSDLDIL